MFNFLSTRAGHNESNLNGGQSSLASLATPTASYVPEHGDKEPDGPTKPMKATVPKRFAKASDTPAKVPRERQNGRESAGKPRRQQQVAKPAQESATTRPT